MQLLNKCPVCGGKLYEDNLCQYSRLYEIGKSGKVLSKYKNVDIGPMDCSCIRCENEDFYTDYEWNIIEPKNFEGTIDFKNSKYYLDTEKRGW